MNFDILSLSVRAAQEKPHAFIMCLTINGFTGNDRIVLYLIEDNN